MHMDTDELTSQLFDEHPRRTSDLLCLLGIFFLSVYALKTSFNGMTDYANILFGFAACTIISFIFYKRYGNWAFHRNIILGGFTTLYLFLLASGGEASSGLLWCYAYPLLTFSVAGPRYGKWMVAVVLLCSLVILYFPEWLALVQHYSLNLRHRFVGSMLLVSIMAYYMEYCRLAAQQQSNIARANLMRQARSDELTGMFNRRGIKAKVQDELHRVVRDRSEMSIVLCDIDLFKRVNDRHGHDVGDLALQHIAQLLSDTVRVTDMVGRWGGEEFLIMLPNTNITKGYQLIERVRERIANSPMMLDGHELNLSISCGICSTRFCSQFNDLIKAADISLYEAKTQGRNCTRPQLVKTGS